MGMAPDMKPTDLRGILQYIPRFRDKIFVISIDGSIITSDHFPLILMDIAVLRSLNIHVIIAHGASAEIEKLGAGQGIHPSDLEGNGVTDSPTLHLAIRAANGLAHNLLEGLAGSDLKAAVTNAITAHPLGILKGTDHLFTGKVERVNTEFLKTLLQHGVIPVVPPLGFDGEGRTYRVNSDRIAVSVATAVQAVKVLFITTIPGLIYRGSLLRQVLVSQLQEFIATDKASFHPGILSKAVHACEACIAGIPRVHVLNGLDHDGIIAEVFSNEGVGSLVYANEYQQIRKALKKDVRIIRMLTQESVMNEELVHRSKSAIEKNLEDYYIFEIDRNPVGCVALHVYPEEKTGELACLYVHHSHENQGIGRKLIQYVFQKAKELQLKTLLAVSTQAFTYFLLKGGFMEATPEDLPKSRLERYIQSGRKAKVLKKLL